MKCYSRGEEIANSVTHGIGALFGIVALTMMVIFAALYGNAWQVVSVAIYGGTLVLLFTMSTLYHAFTNEKVKKVFKIFDHASIYLLIAGTYTPYTLVILREGSSIGWTLFGIVWGIAVLGIVFGTVFIGKFRLLKVLTYLIMGWAIVFAMPELISRMNLLGAIKGIYWLAAGGLSYSVGAIFYIIKVKYFHSIWHLFVLLGSVCHFISIMFYVI